MWVVQRIGAGQIIVLSSTRRVIAAGAVGGAVITYIGDRFGRCAALTFSVITMSVPTFLVGALPGYQTLGVMAPVLLFKETYRKEIATC